MLEKYNERGKMGFFFFYIYITVELHIYDFENLFLYKSGQALFAPLFLFYVFLFSSFIPSVYRGHLVLV